MAADPVVELQSGFVRGTVEKHYEGFDYYAFKGIPYAETPIGELRFQDPVPKKSWTGVLDCKAYGPKCLQIDLFTRDTSISEDCLHLNVFTRSINDVNAMNPVVVVVHGGTFVFGCADDMMYGPEYLIRKNLVLVMFNYRIGVLGFLNLEDEIAPGNQGFKDQVMALRWIQQNIRTFGGDPSNVTVFGTGTGGGASNFLAMSPLTKGLMHKVISSCCVMCTPWLHVRNPRYNATKLCSLLGRELSDPKEILAFLKSADGKRLQEAQEQLRLDLVCPFGPTVDSKSPSPFMPFDGTKHCVELPCLVGYCAREGLFLLAGSTWRVHLDAARDADFAAIFRYNVGEVIERHGLNARQVERLFFKNGPSTADNYVDFVSVVNAIESVHRFVRLQAEKSSAPTYLYVFSYDSDYSLLKSMLKDPPRGAAHLDDQTYLFKMRALESIPSGPLKEGTMEYRIMEQMTEMWANFARYGRPTVETSQLIPLHWQPVADGTLLRHMNIDVDLTMQLTVNLDQMLASARDIRV